MSTEPIPVSNARNRARFSSLDGVTIVGNSALAACMPYDASKLYGRNVLNFLQLIIDKDGGLALNFADDLVKGCCITHDGQVVNERLK